jgi:hypothetical protein
MRRDFWNSTESGGDRPPKSNMKKSAPKEVKGMRSETAKLGREVKRNGLIVLCAMIGTVVTLRVSLYFSPNADLNVGRYNIHHLFTGVLLTTAGAIPLAIYQGVSRKLDLARLMLGAGLGMALDEWVYLIVTDGTNASYALPASLWGGVIFIGLTCVYTAMLMIVGSRGSR